MASGDQTVVKLTPPVPSLQKQLLIENIGVDTTIDELSKCFESAIKQCGPLKMRPEIHLATDKKGRSQGYAAVSVPVSKVDLFLNFDGWYVNNHQMKVSIVESQDTAMKWQSSKKGVFTSSPIRPTVTAKLSHRYSLIDGGVYLTHPTFKTPDHLIELAVKNGIEKLVSLGTSVYHSQEGLKLSQLFSGTVFCTAGVSPRNAVYWTDETEKQLEEVAKCPQCVAIGLCGFDLSSDELITTCDQQMQVFEKQLQLACRLGKPVVVLEDKASVEVMSLLTKYKDQLTRVAVMGRPTDVDTFTQYLEEGFYYFISGDILEKSPPAPVKTWMKDGQFTKYLDQFVLGSQAPKKLHLVGKEAPKYLPEVAEVMADLMETDVTEMAEKLKYNTEKFYGFVLSDKCDFDEDDEKKCGETTENRVESLSEMETGNNLEEKDSDDSQCVKRTDYLARHESESTAGNAEAGLGLDTTPESGSSLENHGEENLGNLQKSADGDESTDIEICIGRVTGTASLFEGNRGENRGLVEAEDSLKDRTGEKTEQIDDSHQTASKITKMNSSLTDEAEEDVKSEEIIMKSSVMTDDRNVGSDVDTCQADVTSGADASPYHVPGQDEGTLTSAVETNWTYRIVLWMAFIAGLLAMYFYEY